MSRKSARPATSLTNETSELHNYYVWSINQAIETGEDLLVGELAESYKHEVATELIKNSRR